MSERASVSVDELNELPASQAAQLLATCCGCRAWVAAMIERRPFGEVESALRAAEELWWSLGPDEWREAFAHHPRIGERDATVAQDSRARAWSAGEQRGLTDADAGIRAAIAEGNREYERRFGHIYLVSAAGKSADQLLAILRARLSNDPATELRVAAGEQAKITRLRMLKLLGADDSAKEAPRAVPRASTNPPSAGTRSLRTPR